MSIDLKTIPMELLIDILNIIILFIILRLLVYKPVKKFMDKRSQRIESDLADAVKKKAEVDELRSEVDKEIKSSEEKANKILREGSAAAETEAERIINSAKEEAQRIIEDAKQTAKIEHDKILSEMQNEITSLSVEIASKIIEREIKPEDNAKLIESFFEKVNEQ